MAGGKQMLFLKMRNSLSFIEQFQKTFHFLISLEDEHLPFYSHKEEEI